MFSQKKKWIAVAALVAGSSSVANAAYITTFTSGQNTQVASATVYDFDNGTKPAEYTGAGSVLSGSLSGYYAAPAGDNTPYLSVAYPLQKGSEYFTANLGQSYNYFGLYWGSIDDYNEMNFFLDGHLVGSVNGLDVIAAGAQLGDQISAGSNRYVNILFTDRAFNQIEFKTSSFAFESDNHAYANVPEPGTLALMGSAFAGLAFIRRRRAALTAARSE
jgi:hypothetical protein